jgi:hypothetical protein
MRTPTLTDTIERVDCVRIWVWVMVRMRIGVRVRVKQDEVRLKERLHNTRAWQG